MRPLSSHEDQIGIGDGRQAMGDDEGGAALAERIERLLDAALGFGVEGAGCLVQDQDRRVLQNGTGDRKALTLTA